jgi:hypothetical protein
MRPAFFRRARLKKLYCIGRGVDLYNFRTILVLTVRVSGASGRIRREADFVKRINSIIRVIVAALLVCCSAAVAQAGSVVLFDQGHGELFHADKSGPLDLSTLTDVMRGAGFQVRSTTERLSEESLKGVDALVISGSFAPLSAAELDAVTTYLGKGGRLCVMLHIGFTVSELLHHIGVDFSNAPIHEQENLIMNNSLNFQVTRMESDPLTAGLQRFNVYGAWALTNFSDDARVIAWTGPTAWVDLDGNQKLSYGDPVQSFGVVVSGRYGKGNFVVFGDDAIFQNQFMGPDNMRLAKNLAEWLKGDASPVKTPPAAKGMRTEE